MLAACENMLAACENMLAAFEAVLNNVFHEIVGMDREGLISLIVCFGLT